MSRCLKPFATTLAIVTRATLIAMMFGAIADAHAATRTVTTLADAGAGSLRDTLAAASDGDTVVFAPTLEGTIVVGSTLVIDRSVTIDGDHRIVLDGNDLVGILNIPAPYTARLRGLTIERGKNDFGGGVLNLGALTIENCRLRDNHGNFGGAITHAGSTLTVIETEIADNGARASGGGIYDVGTGATTIQRSRLTGNHAEYPGGGGIYRGAPGDLTITHSTISGNTVGIASQAQGGGLSLGGGVARIEFSTISANHAAYGGGVYVRGNTLLLLNQSLVAHNLATEAGGGLLLIGGGLIATNSTVSNNRAGFQGGGLKNQTIAANVSLQLRNTTFTQNVAGSSGGGIHTDGSGLTLSNSLIAENGATTNPDVAGTVTSQGYNFIGARGTSTGYIGTDLPAGLTAGLEVLVFNGGPTDTHALVAGSVALDAVPPAICANAGAFVDQRGFARAANANCDIGAFDHEAAPLVDAAFANGFE